MLKRIAVAAVFVLTLTACGDETPKPNTIEVPSWAKVAPEQIAEAKKHCVPVAFENDLGMRFVLIPAGTFLMGSPETEEGRDDNEEGPQHEVTITQAFYLATTETTQAVWTAVMGDNRSEQKGASHPVTDVSWEDCQEFLKRLNKTVPGGGYRMPTEAEWEYACRAGTTTRFSAGDTEKDLKRVGWYDENSDDRLHAVGKKPVNPFGLHDMHGNVWEWCEDTWHDSYDEEGRPDDGSAWADEGPGDRVVRGGSWSAPAGYARSADRGRDFPGLRDTFLGFRPARSVNLAD